MAIIVFSPDSTHKSLDKQSVPYTNLLGTWHVVASTLPLWKNKKNVNITYSLLDDSAQSTPSTTFDDLVSYNKVGDAIGKEPSTVKGIDKLDESSNGASWKWRGKGLLYPVTSSWQLLGYSISAPGESKSPDWVVTYFKSTLFTPSGLDIYSRTPKGLSDKFVKEIVNALEGLGGEVGGLVKPKSGEGMFRVPHDE